MNERTRRIEQLLEQGMSTREISRAVDVSREWVIHIRHRYEARKFKRLYLQLVKQLNGQANYRLFEIKDMTANDSHRINDECNKIRDNKDDKEEK